MGSSLTTAHTKTTAESGADSRLPAPLFAALTPLRRPLFRALWIASLASNIGTWMHEAGAAWLMTSLTESPVLVALMQTATTLPVFMLALPAGALADGADRRRVLLFTQGWMLAVAAVLGLLALADALTPWTLLAFTFALGAGAAVNAPAWQATMPVLVPREDLPSAVALTGMGLNLARALGPALGGAVVAALGPWAVFLLNAVSFSSVIAVLYRWRGPRPKSNASTEPVLASIAAGVRYVPRVPALRAVLVRTGLFVPFASALWALLPAVARHEMKLGSMGYGILFGCLGLGAAAGSFILPQLRRTLPWDRLTAGMTAVFAAALAGLAVVRHAPGLALVMAAGGAAWITVLVSLNVATQSAAPTRVRARALAVYLLVFQGAMAAGGAFWGAVAEHAGSRAALLLAAGGLVASLALARRHRLGNAEIRPAPTVPAAVMPEPLVRRRARREAAGRSARCRLQARDLRRMPVPLNGSDNRITITIDR
ncbi:MAG TPA: MFS transporter [candidate division Zixibacteria bacterium]|nr:MFS transporter [candidate division Zixibacteria bacterium]